MVWAIEDVVWRRSEMPELSILAAKCGMSIRACALCPEERRAAVWAFIVHGTRIVPVGVIVRVVLRIFFAWALH